MFMILSANQQWPANQAVTPDAKGDFRSKEVHGLPSAKKTFDQVLSPLRAADLPANTDNQGIDPGLNEAVEFGTFSSIIGLNQVEIPKVGVDVDPEGSVIQPLKFSAIFEWLRENAQLEGPEKVDLNTILPSCESSVRPEGENPALISFLEQLTFSDEALPHAALAEKLAVVLSKAKTQDSFFGKNKAAYPELVKVLLDSTDTASAKPGSEAIPKVKGFQVTDQKQQNTDRLIGTTKLLEAIKLLYGISRMEASGRIEGVDWGTEPTEPLVPIAEDAGEKGAAFKEQLAFNIRPQGENPALISFLEQLTTFPDETPSHAALAEKLAVVLSKAKTQDSFFGKNKAAYPELVKVLLDSTDTASAKPGSEAIPKVKGFQVTDQKQQNTDRLIGTTKLLEAIKLLYGISRMEASGRIEGVDWGTEPTEPLVPIAEDAGEKGAAFKEQLAFNLKGEGDPLPRGEIPLTPRTEFAGGSWIDGAKTADSQEIPRPGDLFQQIVQKARIAVKAGYPEMEIQLKPDSLGKLKLHIALENGLISARFIAESLQVKHIIEASLPQLKQSLGEQGLQLDRLEVSVDNGSTDQQGDAHDAYFYQNQKDAENHYPYRGWNPESGLTEAEQYETAVITRWEEGSSFDYLA